MFVKGQVLCRSFIYDIKCSIHISVSMSVRKSSVFLPVYVCMSEYVWLSWQTNPPASRCTQIYVHLSLCITQRSPPPPSDTQTHKHKHSHTNS